MPPLRLALTPGEPAGIGPDICLQLAQAGHPHELVAIADPGLLEARAQQLGLAIRLTPLDPQSPPAATPPGSLRYAPVALAAAATPGTLDPANAPYVLATLDRAVAGCQDGTFAALITGPVHKGIINQAGIPFSGHTEYLAAATHSEQVVMLLATPGLRVALATTHLPLAEVPGALTAARLERVLRVLDAALRRRFAIAQPRLLVCGLNPHAGEGGHLGREELEVITPVVARLQRAGLDLIGPLPADSAFTPARLADTDAVVAMYHDQGLPVLKHLGFGQAVNITLGLPLIRTSVDHGTALELAGSGQAQTGSLAYALEVATTMATPHGP